MPTILALDSSTEACSCALWREGELVAHYEVLPRQHAQRLLPMVETLMEQQKLKFTELDAVAFGKGPGSFTGLRIAAGVVQGIAFAADIPVIPISTLAAQALEYAEKHPALASGALILSCLDARIEEVYWGWYQSSLAGLQLLGEEQLTAPEFISLPNSDHSSAVLGSALIAVGSGLHYLPRMPELLRNSFAVCEHEFLPRSSYIATIAATLWAQGERGISPELVEPVYLRDKVTHT